MAVALSNYEEFEQRFKALKSRADLFAFLLFDSRPSQATVERFASEYFDWFDQLAANARMFLFLFLRRDPRESAVINASLHVARLFGIRPNELPGIVFFTLGEDGIGVSRGVYYPLKAELFGAELGKVDKVIADIFTLVHESRDASSQDLLTELDKRVSAMQRSEQRRPALDFAAGALKMLADLPHTLLNSMATAFGRALADGIVQ